MTDPFGGRPLTLAEATMLALALKVQVARAGGRVELTDAEFEQAATQLVKFEKDEVTVVRLVSRAKAV
jgi:hypothetical protein